MKVLFITYLYDHSEGGGAAKSVRDIANGLAQYGHDVVVLTSCRQETSGSVELVDGIRVYRVFPLNLYWVADKDSRPVWEKIFWQFIDTWNPFVYAHLQRVLSIEKPDVVHVHKIRGFSAAVWSGLAKFGVRNIVQTCHDFEAISPEGTLVSRVGQMALRGSLLLRPYQHIRAAASRHVAVVTAPSRATLDIINDRGFFGNAKQYVVPNSHGFSDEQLDEMVKAYPANYIGQPSDDINLLYIGRLEKNKGINLLCEIFEQLLPRYPQLKLHVAGFGTQGEALATRHRNHSSIIFHGPVYGEQKSKLYYSSDVMIIPSLWPEVFGIVIIEAFAHGKPVIGTNIGGIPESIKNDFNGWLIPELSCKNLEGVLCRYLLLTDQKRISIRDHCFASARLYTTEKVMKMYIDIYEGIGK